MNQPTAKCAFAACDCECGTDALNDDDKTYCSQRCVDGRGCDHHGCNCGEFPAAEPQPVGT